MTDTDFVDLSADQEAKLVEEFEALYIDGFGNAPTGNATISLLSDSIHILVETEDVYFKMQFQYGNIELLNVTHEREITALRTFLVGPVLAAWLKKKTRSLTIGYRDETGLLQVPCFKMEQEALETCYAMIVDRIRKLKGPPQSS